MKITKTQSLAQAAFNLAIKETGLGTLFLQGTMKPESPGAWNIIFRGQTDTGCKVWAGVSVSTVGGKICGAAGEMAYETKDGKKKIYSAFIVNYSKKAGLEFCRWMNFQGLMLK